MITQLVPTLMVSLMALAAFREVEGADLGAPRRSDIEAQGSVLSADVLRPKDLGLALHYGWISDTQHGGQAQLGYGIANKAALHLGLHTIAGEPCTHGDVEAEGEESPRSCGSRSQQGLAAAEAGLKFKILNARGLRVALFPLVTLPGPAALARNSLRAPGTSRIGAHLALAYGARRYGDLGLDVGWRAGPQDMMGDHSASVGNAALYGVRARPRIVSPVNLVLAASGQTVEVRNESDEPGHRSFRSGVLGTAGVEGRIGSWGLFAGYSRKIRGLGDGLALADQVLSVQVSWQTERKAAQAVVPMEWVQTEAGEHANPAASTSASPAEPESESIFGPDPLAAPLTPAVDSAEGDDFELLRRNTLRQAPNSPDPREKQKALDDELSRYRKVQEQKAAEDAAAEEAARESQRSRERESLKQEDQAIEGMLRGEDISEDAIPVVPEDATWQGLDSDL